MIVCNLLKHWKINIVKFQRKQILYIWPEKNYILIRFLEISYLYVINILVEVIKLILDTERSEEYLFYNSLVLK